MKNKYVLTRNLNVKFLQDNLKKYLFNCMMLSRYEITNEEVDLLLVNNPLSNEKEIAFANFLEAFNLIVENKVETDYECLIKLHTILMKGLDEGVKSELTQEQIDELNYMINQPAKANTEIALDCMLYILTKRLFSDGDVRVSLMFANKIMIDNGCGVISVDPINDATFRTKMKAFHEGDSDFKDWLYKYCIFGVKVEY